MTGEHCHIVPQPIEAPEPRPVERPQRQLDKVRRDALHKGYAALSGEGPALSSFSSFKAGVEAFEEHMRMWNRRAR